MANLVKLFQEKIAGTFSQFNKSFDVNDNNNTDNDDKDNGNDDGNDNEDISMSVIDEKSNRQVSDSLFIHSSLSSSSVSSASSDEDMDASDGGEYKAIIDDDILKNRFYYPSNKIEEVIPETEEDTELLAQTEILSLFLDYRKSITYEDEQMKKMDDNIIMKNQLERYINILEFCEDMETLIKNSRPARRISKKKVVTSSTSKTAVTKPQVPKVPKKRGRPRKVVTATTEDDKKSERATLISTNLSKKYQKLYSQHSLLESEFDELKEKYAKLQEISNSNSQVSSRGHNDIEKISSDDENDGGSSSDDDGFHFESQINNNNKPIKIFKELKLDRRLISSHLDEI